MSITLIAYNYAHKVPVSFESMHVMEYAQLEALRKLDDCATARLMRWQGDKVLSVEIVDEKWHVHVVQVLRALFNQVHYCTGDKKRHCMHLVVYDFDGTIFAERLYQSVIHALDKQGYGALERYMRDLTSASVVQSGFGDMSRVNALKQHFAQLRRMRPQLLVVLYPRYHKRWVLTQLLGAIGVKLDDWFDVVLDDEHYVVEMANSLGGCKDSVLRSLSAQLKVDLQNVLYVDDDPKLRERVSCCSVKLLKNRRGMTLNEMKWVLHNMQQRLRQKQTYVHMKDIQPEDSCGSTLQLQCKLRVGMRVYVNDVEEKESWRGTIVQLDEHQLTVKTTNGSTSVHFLQDVEVSIDETMEPEPQSTHTDSV